MQLDLIEGLNQENSGRPSFRSGAFTDNMKLPVHRWFRYSAGFSADWAEAVIRSVPDAPAIRVLDPFCGSGTTLLAAAKAGATAVGLETHPFVARIAKAKLNVVVDPNALQQQSELVLSKALQIQQQVPSTTSPLLLKCYSPENLTALEALQTAYRLRAEKRGTDDVNDLIWLAITCILRECSGAGTAQWQYVLPNKSKTSVSEPFQAFSKRIAMFVDDLFYAQHTFKGSGTVLGADAREPGSDGVFDLVVTSPPYPNNYDYADATRLEMTFWGEVSSWSDLQGVVRRLLVRSCSQHSAAEKLQLDDLLSDPHLEPILADLTPVCRALEAIRLERGGRKTYHTMIAAYFTDLARVWTSLRSQVKEGGQVAFMIGDSAPYGVYVPCDDWLGRLALAAGFKAVSFEKIRDRNIKWKNRKHRVPLKEGILWVEA